MKSKEAEVVKSAKLPEAPKEIKEPAKTELLLKNKMLNQDLSCDSSALNLRGEKLFSVKSKGYLETSKNIDKY